MKANYHASSIHCSYYGLYQKMKYTIKIFQGISYADLDSHSRSSKLNSHAFLIDQVSQSYLKEGKTKKEAHQLHRKIMDLKGLREAADYDNTDMNSNDSNNAYDLSLRLIQELKQTFKI